MTDNTGGVLAGDHRDHPGLARRASDPGEPRFHCLPDRLSPFFPRVEIENFRRRGTDVYSPEHEWRSRVFAICTDAIGCWGNETYGLARQSSFSRTELFHRPVLDTLGSHFLGESIFGPARKQMNLRLRPGNSRSTEERRCAGVLGLLPAFHRCVGVSHHVPTARSVAPDWTKVQ